MPHLIDYISAKTKLYLPALIVVSGIFIFVMQVWNIHVLWTPVGFVDTWPLYDRLMKFDTGQLSFDHYLFDPHVHPHSIVYFLYLIDTRLGSGRQLIPHYATILSIIGLIVTIGLVVKKAFPDRSYFDVSVCVFFVGTIILVSGLSEATIIPFQTVVITTRFIYVFLLAVLISCQFRPNPLWHASALLASIIAVSFYASGGVFAAEIILLHCIFFRRWEWLLVSVLPLVAYICLIAAYTHPSAETIAMKAILKEMDFTKLGQIGLSTICYYASVFVQGWPWPLGVGFGRSEIALFVLASLICLFTLAWTVKYFFCLIQKSFRAERDFTLLETANCLMAFISLWVFISSLSAALLWLARAKIFGASMGMPVHYAVLTSNRYAAFSSLSVVVLLFILIKLKPRLAAVSLSFIMFFIISIVAVQSMSFHRMQEHIEARNQLEYAATALLMGLSPAGHEASAIWPGVDSDWFWPSELPKTSAFLQQSKISYAYGLPNVGQGRYSSWPTTKMTDYEVFPVKENPHICRLIGNATPYDNKLLLVPQRFYTLTTEGGTIVGYALHDSDAVEGHVLCISGRNQQSLYLSAEN